MTDPQVMARRAKALRLHRALERVWSTPPGFGRLSAVNHTVVGRRFMLTALVFFAIGGLFAMLLRTQLAQPLSNFLDVETYNQLVTLHGTVMMFLFAIPMIEGAAIYLLPKLLGARDLAFPRLSAFGYWCYLLGGTIVAGSIVFGVAPDSGWFMYTPLSSRPYSPGIGSDIWLLGITFVEVSAIAAAVEIVVSILKVRAPGMALSKMPLFVWYILVTMVMIIGGFPPLILASIMLEVERAFDWPFFDPARGGDPLLWQHLFWLFGHPEVYIIFLPAAGAISTILPVFARTPIVGYTWIVASVIALGFLSFGLWVHHMFATGLPRLSLAFFSAASLLVVIPQAVQIFAWLATLYRGRPELTVPMLFILGFFGIFVIGGLTGVMVAIVPFDEQVHDTHFVVAHLHYVLIGGFVFPIMAAVYYWMPQIFGRIPMFNFGKVVFWLVFVGFNVTFLVMHWTGLIGMPRRVFTYGPETGFFWPNMISSFGSFLLTAGFGLFFVDILLQIRHGRSFRRNPWKAGTLEWAQPTPPTSYGFASLPRVKSRDPLHDDPNLPAKLAAGEGYLARVKDDRMETLGVDMVHARPQTILVLPNADFTPLWTSLCLAFFFGMMLAGQYAIAPLGFVGVAFFGWRWAASMALREDPVPEEVRPGERLPLHFATRATTPFWGTIFLLVADAVLFGSLLFGSIFLAAFGPNWPDTLTPLPGVYGIVAALGVFVTAIAAQVSLAAMIRRGAVVTGLVAQSVAAIAAAVTAIALLLFLLLDAPAPTVHAEGAVVGALAVYVAIHALIGVLISAFAVVQTIRGYASPVRALPFEIAAAWQTYLAITGLLALATLYFVLGAVR